MDSKQSPYPDWPADWFVVVGHEHRPCSVCGRETQYISVTFHCPICSQECDAAMYRECEELERKNGVYAEDLDWKAESELMDENSRLKRKIERYEKALVRG